MAPIGTAGSRCSTQASETPPSRTTPHLPDLDRFPRDGDLEQVVEAGRRGVFRSDYRLSGGRRRLREDRLAGLELVEAGDHVTQCHRR